jgi:hypothetical protein
MRDRWQRAAGFAMAEPDVGVAVVENDRRGARSSAWGGTWRYHLQARPAIDAALRRRWVNSR